MSKKGHFDLEAYVQGKLTAAENEKIIGHLIECDECLEVVEEIWKKHTGNLAADGPPLSKERSERLELRVFKEIHRGDLAVEAIRFAVVGFGEALKGLLLPLMETINHPDKEEKK